jgi:hypothetical protein
VRKICVRGVRKMDWREELVEILGRVDKYEKLGGIRALATFVKNSLYSDRDYLDSVSVDFRWYSESADVRVRFLDPYFQIEIDLGYLSVKQSESFEEFKKKLLEKKTEFVIKALAMLVSELEDILYRAQQKCEDP